METKQNKFLEFVVNVIFGLSLIGFFTAFNFSDKMNGWHQQFLPAGITNNINSLVFTDSLTGYIATANDNNGVSYLLKTTNSGDNWFNLLRDTTVNIYRGLKFFNKDTALILGSNKIYKTTNAGINWVVHCSVPGVTDYFALNLDTIFSLDAQSIIGGFWRTTNGGTSWVKLVNFGSMNPEGVYFYNKNIGYINRGGGTWKTTDGGFNWFQISGPYGNMYFFDSLFGYKAAGFTMSKTTDGGMNWSLQQLPNTFDPGMLSFSCINKDTIFGAGGIISNNGYNGIIYKTINGGDNWGYQQPLTNNSIIVYSSICFSNKLNGWAYKLYSTGVHTNVGGSDTTIFTGINPGITNVPNDYVLYQNYPNPFNSTSNIKYKISKSTNVKIEVMDILGRNIKTLVNMKQPPGNYEVMFNGENISSGIYFYTLFSDGNRIETRKMTLLK